MNLSKTERKGKKISPIERLYLKGRWSKERKLKFYQYKTAKVEIFIILRFTSPNKFATSSLIHPHEGHVGYISGSLLRQ